ncbi:MAG: DUF4280 domain-containing protein [Lachnospiraceae bacterium]|nr:DUF4280 domain-containing protein [Lachnospiraceae bacterium]
MGDEIRSYVTRGVVLKCDCGSHTRCANLIKDHGWGIDIEETADPKKKMHPFLLDCDIVVGDENKDKMQQQNIAWFGVCKKNPENTEDILLKPDARLGEEKNVNGKKCKPVILEGWQNCKEKFVVKSLAGDGKPLTSESYLVCKYGGVISIYKSENNEDDNNFGFGYSGDLDA